MSTNNEATAVAPTPFNFLDQHDVLDVMDVLQNAKVALHLQGYEEEAEAFDSEDLQSIKEQNHYAGAVMQHLIMFVSNAYNIKAMANNGK